MYALCDCNNFFVSCERVFRPDLEHRPVLVLSGNDGCVVSRSNEAKALGIKMGVPAYQIQGEIDKHNITCFSSNFALYGDLSARVMSILRTHTGHLDQYSIDEGFMRVEPSWGEDPAVYARQIVKQIRHGVGIPVSIGIAPSKTLAKIAGKYAKQYPGYHGSCAILTDEQRLKALSNFPIADVWGIGRMAQQKLAKAGIRTAADFARCSAEFAQNLLHKPGLLTWQELNGQDVIRTDEIAQKQTITHSRTFAEAITNQAVIEREISDFCSRCARQLRIQHSLCSELTVYAHTSRFRTEIEQHYIVASVRFQVATADSRELILRALEAFRSQYKPGILYKKAGVILSRITPDSVREQDLFDTRDHARDNRLQQAMDHINDRLGRDSLMVGSQLHLPGQKPVYRQNHHSPLYTTRLDDIIVVKA